MNNKGFVEIKWWMLALILAILAFLIFIIAIVSPTSANLMAVFKLW